MRLNRNLYQSAWVAIAQQEWSATTSWADTVNTLGKVVSIATALLSLILLACVV